MGQSKSTTSKTLVGKADGVFERDTIARQIGMTRARVSQIMRLLRLPPVIFEKLLLADPTHFPKLTERQLRSLTTASVPAAQLEVLERRLSNG